MTFDEAYPRLEKLVEKRRGKWTLSRLKYINFDDIKTEILVHIYKKWGLYDQSRSLEAWASTIITNQMINRLRNHYGKYVRPCIGCAFAEGDNLCKRTKSGIQSDECSWYAEWVVKKKDAYEIQFAQELDAEIEDGYINSRKPEYDTSKELDFEIIIEKIADRVKNELAPVAYKAFVYLYIEKVSEEEVAKRLGYKTPKSGNSSDAGKRQIFYYKKKYKEIARKMLEEEEPFHL